MVCFGSVALPFVGLVFSVVSNYLYFFLITCLSLMHSITYLETSTNLLFSSILYACLPDFGLSHFARSHSQVASDKGYEGGSFLESMHT